MTGSHGEVTLSYIRTDNREPTHTTLTETSLRALLPAYLEDVADGRIEYPMVLDHLGVDVTARFFR